MAGFNPFRKFRVYRKVALAALGLVAIISFVILPSYLMLQRDPTSGKEGLIATFRNSRYGNIDQYRMHDLHQSRNFLRAFYQRFLTEMLPLAGNDMSKISMLIAANRGYERQLQDEELIINWLLAQYAREKGIVISNELIVERLNSLSGGMLTNAALSQICQDLGQSEGHLIYYLQEEMLSSYLRTLFDFSTYPTTPLSRWEYYQRLNRQVTAEVAAIPVDAFRAEVKAAPSEAELRAFFEENKNRVYNPAMIESGFATPKRIAFQMINATPDENLINSITQEEIEQYYEENKTHHYLRDSSLLQPQQPSGGGLPSNLLPGLDSTLFPSIPTDSSRRMIPGLDMLPEPGLNIPVDAPATDPTPEPDAATPPEQPQDQPQDQPQSHLTQPGVFRTVAYRQDEQPEEPQAEEPKPEEPKVEEPQPEEPKVEEPQPEEPKAEEPQPEEPKAEEPKAEEPQPEEPKVEEPQPEEPKAEEPQPEEPKVEEPQPEEPKAEEPQPEEPKAEEPQAEEPKAEEPKPEEPKVEEPQPEEPKAEEPKPEEPKVEEPQPEEPKAEEPKVEEPQPEEPKVEEPQPEEPKTEEPEAVDTDLLYQPLSEVEGRIRTILAMRKVEEAIKDIEQQMRNYFLETLTINVLDESALPKFDLAAVAAKHHLSVLTVSEPTSIYEAQEQDYWKSTAARGFLAQAFSRSSVNYDVIVGREMYMGYSGPLQYIGWVTKSESIKTPEFTDPGVKEQVEQRWSLIQARKLAEARAQELAEIANQSPDKPLSESLANQDQNLAFVETSPFTWYRESYASAGYRQSMLIFGEVCESGVPQGTADHGNHYIKAPGAAFMEAAYSLQVGQSGVAMNQPETFVYVIRVKETSPDETYLWNLFTGTSNHYYLEDIKLNFRQEAFLEWVEQIEKSVGFKWINRPEPISLD